MTSLKVLRARVVTPCPASNAASRARLAKFQTGPLPHTRAIGLGQINFVHCGAPEPVENCRA